MEDNRIHFYEFFKFGNYIGVNRLTLTDVLFANFMAIVVTIILVGTLATLVPFFMLFLYLTTIMLGSWDKIDNERIVMCIVSIIGYIYFMIDYHFGFIGWKFFNTFFGVEFVDKLCYIHTALFLFNILLIIYGNQIIRAIKLPIARLLVFIIMIFIGYNILLPMSIKLSPKITTQHIPKPTDILYTNHDEDEDTSTVVNNDSDEINYWEIDSFDE